MAMLSLTIVAQVQNMPGNFGAINFANYQLHIPDIYLPEVTAAIKSRLRLDDKRNLAGVVITATSRGNLLIFCQRKLLKCCHIPFSDCSQVLTLHSYQSGVTKEFLVAFSATKGAVVIDIQALSLVKTWPDAKKVELKDENCLGYPQVIVHFNDDKIVVTHETGWEPMFKDESETMQDDSALKSVIQALENQLNNVHEQLLSTEKQISLRQTILNRSLAALSDAIIHRNCRVQAPTYTTKLVKGGDDPTQHVFASIQENQSSSSVESCGVWQFMDYISENWIVGTAFTNTSGRTLHNIQCYFVSNNENMNYRIRYYLTDSKVLTRLPTNGFYALLETSKEFSGTLDHDSGFVVIVIASVPKFINAEKEVGSLLLSFTSQENPSKIVQLKLCCAHLNFNDVCSQKMSFNPSIRDLTYLRRNILGLITSLQTEANRFLSTSVSLAFECFKKASQQLNMQHLSAMQCFYCLGVYGHVFVLILENNPHRLQLKIRAQSERKIQWFIHHLKLVLSEDCTFAITTTINDSSGRTLPVGHLSSVLSLLSITEIDEDDDEPMVVEETTTTLDSVLDNIRKEFVRKQGKIFGMNKARSSNLKLSLEQYQQIQNSWFI